VNSQFDATKMAAEAVAAASAALQALAPGRMQLNTYMLPKFDGRDFLLFQKQFESLALDQEWTDRQKARKLVECLEGTTRRHVDGTMTYAEMLQALRQYYAGARPSVEAKNKLRNFKKGIEETIEAFASRIQAYADEARLTNFEKERYMQEAFMNGIQYDTKMQRYIEKKTPRDQNVHIVQLLKAAQDYQHEKQGSTRLPTEGMRQKKGVFNQHAVPEYDSNGDSGDDGYAPTFNVLKTGRKEALTHEDESVAQEVAEEQARLQAEKAEKNKNRGMSKNEAEEMRQRMIRLEEAQRQMISTAQQQVQTAQQQLDLVAQQRQQQSQWAPRRTK
jgi:hypothetical protein